MKATARSIGTTSVPKVMVTPDSAAPPAEPPVDAPPVAAPAADVPPVAAPAADVPPSDVPPPVIVAPPTPGAPPIAGLPAIGTLAAPADVIGGAPPFVPKSPLVSMGGAPFECSATPQAAIPTTHSPVSSTLARSLLIRALIIGLPPNWPKVGLPRRRKDRFAARAANSEHPRSARRAVGRFEPSNSSSTRRRGPVRAVARRFAERQRRPPWRYGSVLAMPGPPVGDSPIELALLAPARRPRSRALPDGAR